MAEAKYTDGSKAGGRGRGKEVSKKANFSPTVSTVPTGKPNTKAVNTDRPRTKAAVAFYGHLGRGTWPGFHG